MYRLNWIQVKLRWNLHNYYVRKIVSEQQNAYIKDYHTNLPHEQLNHMTFFEPRRQVNGAPPLKYSSLHETIHRPRVTNRQNNQTWALTRIGKVKNTLFVVIIVSTFHTTSTIYNYFWLLNFRQILKLFTFMLPITKVGLL